MRYTMNDPEFSDTYPDDRSTSRVVFEFVALVVLLVSLALAVSSVM
jgi:hypothetical protein